MFYRNLRTKAVFIKNTMDAMLTASIKCGEVEAISQEDYDRSQESATIGTMVKRIYATVDHHDFSNFQKRCKAEGIAMDNAFSMLVCQYGAGAMLTHVSKKVKTFNYLEEIKNGKS